MSVFDDLVNDCLGGLENFFNSFWDSSEEAIETALNESGKSVVAAANGYKNIIIDYYNAAKKQMNDDKAATIRSIHNKLTDPKEIKRAEEKADELKVKRQNKLEEKKKAQLNKLNIAKERWIKKLNG